MIIDYPLLDRIEQLIKKCDESFIDDESKSFLGSFYKGLFDTVGDLSNKKDLESLLDYLLKTSDKFYVFLSIGVPEEKRSGLMTHYNGLIEKVKKEL